jgi:hypothetical protein
VGGWLTRRAQNVALDKINEVNYERTFWGRTLWSTGTIVVETAATAGIPGLHWAADDDPFRHALEDEIEKRKCQLSGRTTATTSPG